MYAARLYFKIPVLTILYYEEVFMEKCVIYGAEIPFMSQESNVRTLNVMPSFVKNAIKKFGGMIIFNVLYAIVLQRVSLNKMLIQRREVIFIDSQFPFGERQH